MHTANYSKARHQVVHLWAVAARYLSAVTAVGLGTTRGSLAENAVNMFAKAHTSDHPLGFAFLSVADDVGSLLRTALG